MKRVFAAIVPDAGAIAELAAHIDHLRSAFRDVPASWVPPANLHLTLHFAGEVDETQLESFQSHVEAAAGMTSAFQASLDEAGAFVDKRMGRSVLWVGIKESDGHDGVLGAAVREIKTREGDRSKRFVPHLTIARVRGMAPTDLLDAHRTRGLEPLVFDVNEFVVLESTLTRSGSIYNVVSWHRLSRGT
jgi:2'-5' RNA ligase